VSDRRDASTRALPRHWQRTDEWYGFAASLRGSIRVLATVDETSYAPGDSAMGGHHPIAWSQLYGGGRSWYTALGHTPESYAEPLFRQHLLGGVLWAAGPPVIGSLRRVVRDRRLVVTGTEARCVGCRGQLRVRLGARSTVARLGIRGSSFAGRSAVLPRGRWPYTVTLTSDGSGLRTSRAGTIRIG
jgi:hypothetical protein